MRRQMSGLAVGVLLGMGCVSDSVVFSTATMYGIELNAVEQGGQTIKVGFHRVEGVVMPMVDDDGNLLDEAYPVAAAYKSNTGALLLAALTNNYVRQSFATGAAADSPLAQAGVINALQANAADVEKIYAQRDEQRQLILKIVQVEESQVPAVSRAAQQMGLLRGDQPLTTLRDFKSQMAMVPDGSQVTTERLKDLQSFVNSL